MNPLIRNLLATVIVLQFCTAVMANDAPAEASGHDKKAEPAKPATPAEKDLPSRPYPKNAAAVKAQLSPPKPAGDAAGAPAPAPVVPEKRDQMMDKLIDKLANGDTDKPAPVKRRKSMPRPEAAPQDPAMQQLINETVNTEAARVAAKPPYIVQPRETLEQVIKKTFPATPFSPEVMRTAFIKANPQLVVAGRLKKLRAGQNLQLPDAALLRMLVLGETASPAKATATASGTARLDSTPIGTELPKAASATIMPAEANAVLAVPRRPVAMPVGVNGEVLTDEKKKWIRFP